MALRRNTRSVDGTIPVQALLYNDEEIYASQEGVGIYDGLQKSPNHQSGTVHISTHRLFYIDAYNAYKHSFSMDLSYITQTEYYAGLFKSSPKVTLHLSGSSIASGQGTNDDVETGFESWECEVCAYRNPPGLSPAAARVCGLCGVPRSSVPVSSASPIPHHLSSSLPSSAVSSATSSVPSLSNQPLDDAPSTIACPACTFLNHLSLRSCEMCSTELPRAPRRALKSAPSTRPPSPDPEDEDLTAIRMIKISFRRGGDKAFYAVLKRCLKSKAWEANGIGGIPHVVSSSPDSTPVPDRNTIGRSGITGILRDVETSAQGRETGMLDALHDLEALMVKAKDMVRLAAELNEKLTAASTAASAQSSLSPLSPQSSLTALNSAAEPEEATFIRSSLSQLGLQMANTPVTLDMMKDEKRWIEELARELAQVLQGSSDKDSGMMRTRGMIALDEVWGGWNRARGVALIPPSTFLLVLPHLPQFTSPPIQARTFASGLSVLHTPPYTSAAFAARLSGLLALTGPKTTAEVAREEGITLGLAEEMIGAVEAEGDVCRDEGEGRGGTPGAGAGAELRWWANLFVGYVWDGQV
ncbi:Vacuolar protein-sorting-associated protein 36 [Hypsizygus marmoreus]|uniref:Vacuolar protein-sorting-associated protein 36 n=1 Tax=Hypsizygus marmoreus TaxID=39966 RepID=A0A369JAI0_HYPMA|nr:Vacuolar protein-sorting-associated protein 36 [Hypsizygus marmoreus]